MSSQPSDGEPEAAAARCGERCRCALRRLNRGLQARWLVGFVRSVPVLHDPRHPRHRDAALAELLWGVIGRNLGLPGKTCEKEWKKLCASYERSMYTSSSTSVPWLLYSLRDDVPAAEADPDDDARSGDADDDRELASASSGAAEEDNSWAGEPHPVDAFLARVAVELKLLPPYELSVAMDEISRAARKYTPKARRDGEVKLTVE